MAKFGARILVSETLYICIWTENNIGTNNDPGGTPQVREADLEKHIVSPV